MKRGRRTAAVLALVASVVLCACAPEVPTLSPAVVTADRVTSTPFVVDAPRAAYLQSHGPALELRPGVEVWIGGQRASVTAADARGLSVRLPVGLGVGRHDLRVVGSLDLRNADALQVVDGMPADGGPLDAASADAGPDDAAPEDAGRGDAGPGDAGADDAGRVDAGVDPTRRSPPCDATDTDLLICTDFEGDGADASSFGNTLSIIGASFVPGVDGQSLELSSASDCRWPDAASLRPTRFSLSAWIRPAEWPADGERMALFDKDGQFGVFVMSDGSLECAFGGPRLRAPLGSPGIWAHVACVRDATAVRLYVDGALEASDTAMVTVSAGTAPLTLGQNSPGGGDSYLGRVDQLRFYQRALTDAEVRAASGR